MVRDYKRLIIWREAYDLALKVYEIVESLPEKESKNIADQMRRAATSIPLNIAEGAGANSNKIFLSFLGHAYRSAKELEVLLMLCRDLKYITGEKFEEVQNKLEHLRVMMYKVMIKVEEHVKKRNILFYKKPDDLADF